MKNLKPATIRLAHPLAFSAFLREIGAPVEGYFRRNGLPTQCKDPNAIVPLNKAWNLFHDVARREGRDVAWQIGNRVGDQELNHSFLQMLEKAPTLYLALQLFVRKVKSEASHLELGIVERKFDILFYTQYPGMREEPGHKESQAYQLTIYVDFIRHFVGRDWCPSEIGIEAAYKPAHLARLFPTTVIRINQPFGFVAVSRKFLHQKLSTRHKLQNSKNLILTLENLSYPRLLEVLLEPYISQGYPTLDLAAELMDTSPRSLSRHLANHGTGYQFLVDKVRFKKSRELLRENGRPINDIAWSLGFTDQANFSRFFRRMAGLTPRQYRVAEHSPA